MAETRFTIREFAPADLATLDPDGMRVHAESGLDWRAMARDAAGHGPAWTARWDGRVIGVAGLAMLWRGRAAAWCLLDRDIPRRAWMAIHAAVAYRLRTVPLAGIWRVEADSVVGYAQAARWLRLLGFECEGQARAYGPDGSDYLRWARIA